MIVAPNSGARVDRWVEQALSRPFYRHPPVERIICACCSSDRLGSRTNLSVPDLNYADGRCTDGAFSTFDVEALMRVAGHDPHGTRQRPIVRVAAWS